MKKNWNIDLLASIVKVKLARKPIPLLCHWEVTYKCNLNCVFCATRFNANSWSPETTASEALGLLSQAARMGSKVLNLVGGEPTRRSDLPQIIKHAHELGMKVSITTNGIMEEERRHWLLDADVVRVSIDGTPALNSSLRRSGTGADYTDESVKTLKFLKRHGKRPMIVSIYSAKTKKEDIDFLTGLARELRIRITFYPTGCGFSDKRGNFTLQEREERKRLLSDILIPLNVFIERISDLRTRYPDCVSRGGPYLAILKRGGLDNFGCLAMNTAICLKPDGSVAMPCIEYPQEVVKSNDLASVFYGEKAGGARRQQGKYWFCKNCTLNCMISSTALTRLATLFYMAREYLPYVFGEKK